MELIFASLRKEDELKCDGIHAENWIIKSKEYAAGPTWWLWMYRRKVLDRNKWMTEQN